MALTNIPYFISRCLKHSLATNMILHLERTCLSLNMQSRKFLYSSCMHNKCMEFKNSVQYSKSRYFSRGPKSWFRTKKKSYGIVDLCDVSPKRLVPDYIPKPVYAESGVDLELKNDIEILDSESVVHMKQSCSLARIVLDEVSRHINVGVTTDELDAIAHSTCIGFGAYPSPLNYRGFPKSICTSVNNVVCHGIPDSRKLQDGDIISVDISVFYDGFHGDCASTYYVGNVDDKAHKLIEIAALCLQEAINVCKHNQDFCAIGKTISELAEEHGFTVIPAFCGHGIGRSFHCSPNILHYANEEEGKMQKGMIFTIEPVICEGQPDIMILEDGWTAVTEDNSRSAQFEHTVHITETGAEILTVPDAFKMYK